MYDIYPGLFSWVNTNCLVLNSFKVTMYSDVEQKSARSYHRTIKTVT